MLLLSMVVGGYTYSPTSGGQQQGPKPGEQGPIGPPRKVGKILTFFEFFRPMEKMASDGPKQGWEDFFPTNPDLADILGRTDLDFDNFYFFDLLDRKFLDFQVPRLSNSQIEANLDCLEARPTIWSWHCCHQCAIQMEYHESKLKLSSYIYIFV